MVGGDLLIAATICTKRFTKGEVQVKADAFITIKYTELLREASFPIIAANRFFPIGHGRIRCISRHRLVVFFK